MVSFIIISFGCNLEITDHEQRNRRLYLLAKQKQEAATLYNEAIHPPRQSSGIFALIVGVALGWILGSRKTLLSMAANFTVTALVLSAPFAHAEWG